MGRTEYHLVSDGVLAEFRDRADAPEFWAAQWKSTDYRRFLERYENGYLGEFARVFPKYLPKDRLILEAGCGRGQYVYALQRLGYRVVGVDFSAELVARVKEAKAAVNVVVGDVRALDFEDRSLGAYISLGVVEHFWDGMGGILSEARRVLEDAGVLLLSVPHFSPLFRRRTAKRCWTQRNTGCCGVAK